MKTLHFNGEYWYEDESPLLARVAEWVVWFGGWNAHGPKSRFGARPLRERLKYELLTPISILGHRATFYGHWFDVRTPWGILVVNLRERYAFLSRNGTPGAAHAWLYGAPAGVREDLLDAIVKAVLG